MTEVKLDIGCGLKKREGFLGIDIVRTESVNNLPFRDSSIDVIYTRHTLEHVDNFEKAVKEMWRVSKPNAIIEIIVPFLAHHYAHYPLHKRFFNRFSFDENTYKSTFANIFPACEIYFKLRVIK